MKEGYIPKITVKNTKTKSKKNSLFVISLTFSSKNLLYEPPNAILLNIYIVYAADNIIEELANKPKKGNLSKTP